jgi:uncharacterized protein YndB with AHSA1/START domain
MDFDPERDLELARELAAPPASVWRCWSEAALLERWFAPHPVVTRDVVIDLVPGGRFRSTMDIPGTGSITSEGCILVVEPGRRLVWTDRLEGGFRPAGEGFGLTVEIRLEPSPAGTAYRARAVHATAATRAQHEAMGFAEGWGAATSQLEALARGL